MADVLTLGQQQINSSALSGPIEISGTFQQQLVPTGMVLTLLRLLYQSGISAPLPLVATFIVGTY